MLKALLASLRRRPLTVWYHPAYRLPLSGTEGSTAMDPRRANHALHYLIKEHAVRPEDLATPKPVTYADLARVHAHDWLEALGRPATLAHVFAVDESDVVVDELLATVRLACGGTVEATRAALATGTRQLNLLGGFHHAAPARGVGFCAINDVAVAIACARADGFDGPIAVIDLDAHPPDGTAECTRADERVWLGSISGVSWGPLAKGGDVVLPAGSSDEVYLAALDALLHRMPPVELALVLAGGDVLVGDRLGVLGLSVAGARQRDLRVIERLAAVPSVWLPAGGYSPHAWKVLAGTGLALAFETAAPIPPDFDPLGAELQDIAMTLSATQLAGQELVFTEADFPELYGRQGNERLLGYYTRDGIEYALERYGVLPLVRRLGFEEIVIAVDASWLKVKSRGLVLLELEVSKKEIQGSELLFVNWLSLRNPRAHFSEKRPQLPGQEVPGLGLAQEATLLLALMAERLNLEGVAFNPSWFHLAYAARHSSRFLDPRRHGRFEALVRDLRDLTLLDATRAVAEGRVTLAGQPYRWEAEPMVHWIRPDAHPYDKAAAVEERERCRFSVHEPARG